MHNLNNNVAVASALPLQGAEAQPTEYAPFRENRLVVRVEDLSLQSGLPRLREILVEVMTIKKWN